MPELWEKGVTYWHYEPAVSPCAAPSSLHRTRVAEGPGVLPVEHTSAWLLVRAELRKRCQALCRHVTSSPGSLQGKQKTTKGLSELVWLQAAGCRRAGKLPVGTREQTAALVLTVPCEGDGNWAIFKVTMCALWAAVKVFFFLADEDISQRKVCGAPILEGWQVWRREEKASRWEGKSSGDPGLEGTGWE